MSENLTQQLPDDPLRLILARLDSIDSRMGRLEDRMSGLEDRMTVLEGRVTGLEGRMTALDEKVDRRLQETRPIWEQVLAELKAIHKRLDGVESEVYDLNKKLRVFNTDILKLQNKQEDLEERLDELDSHRAG